MSQYAVHSQSMKFENKESKYFQNTKTILCIIVFPITKR